MPFIFIKIATYVQSIMLGFGQMKKSDLAREAARLRGVEPEAAADQMDRAVHKIVRALRKGQAARLPGLGTITPGRPWGFSPEKQKPCGFSSEKQKPCGFGPEKHEG